MRLDAGRDLVLRDVRESDAADLLPVTQELGPAQDEKPAECLLQRVGLARTGAGLETEAATIVEASADAPQRNEAGGVGWALPLRHGRAVRRRQLIPRSPRRPLPPPPPPARKPDRDFPRAANPH